MTGWNCYGSPVAALPPLEQLTVRALKNARGIFRKGMTVEQVWRMILSEQTQKPKLTARNRERMEIALLRVEDAGIAVGDGGKWRMA